MNRPALRRLALQGALACAAALALAPLPVLAEDILRVSAIPDEAPTELQRKFAPLGKYLEGQTGVKVVFTPVSDYAAVVESLASRKIDLAWLMLVLLSVGGAGIARSDANAVLVAVGVSLVMAIKLRLVCNYFLELHEAHPRIRRAVLAFCHGMPILVILTTAFGDTLSSLTGALLG